jgi:hypothetical protein
MLGDDIITGQPPCLRQMIDHSMSTLVIAVEDVPRDHRLLRLHQAAGSGPLRDRGWSASDRRTSRSSAASSPRDLLLARQARQGRRQTDGMQALLRQSAGYQFKGAATTSATSSATKATVEMRSAAPLMNT